MKWSEGETVKFVELYRGYWCLWNVTEPSYRNNQMRSAALEKLVRDMGVDGFTVADARQKIKSLRNTYSQELQKIEKCLKLGMGADDIYTPMLKWFHILNAFMKETKEKRSTRSNMISQPIRQSEENTENQLESEPGTSEETSNATSQTSSTSVVSEGRNLKTTSQKEKVHSSLAGSKRRYQDLSTAVSELRDINYSLLQSGNEEDEFGGFGRYIALALKKLPLHLALQCQNELQTTLTRYRCMALTPSPFTSQKLPSPTGSSHSSGKIYWGSNYSTQPPLQSPQSPGYQLPPTPAPPSSERRSPLSSPVQQPPLLSPTIYDLPPAPLDQQQQSFLAPGYQLLQSTSDQNVSLSSTTSTNNDLQFENVTFENIDYSVSNI